jgi:hypothetical protein
MFYPIYVQSIICYDGPCPATEKNACRDPGVSIPYEVEKVNTMAQRGEERKWRFAVDRGGTFTDVVGVDPRGKFHTLKLLSSSADYEDPSIEGIRRVVGGGPGREIPGDLVHSIRFGTTAATNALLERKGGRVVLFITKGFRDLLDIGYQSRPDIFTLCIQKASQLYIDVVEVEERTGPDGSVIKGLEREIRFLKPAKVSIISERRALQPYGMAGGGSGMRGENLLKKADGKSVRLGHRAFVEAEKGDAVIIKPPGGGGYGEKGP